MAFNVEEFEALERQKMRAFEDVMAIGCAEPATLAAHAKQGELKASADLNAEARRADALEVALRLRNTPSACAFANAADLIADAAAIEAFLRDGKQSST